MGEKHVELTCSLHDSNCKRLDNREYFFRYTSAMDSVYEDCPNIEIYEITPQKTLGGRRGIFCLLTDIEPK